MSRAQRTVLIADDEPLARQRLCQLLHRFDQLNVVGECATGTDAIAAVVVQKPDVLFLDVQMPGLDGFAVLSALDERIDARHMPLIIFVTAFDEHATRAFDVAALDYVRKPISRHRLSVAVARAMGQLELRDAALRADGASKRSAAEMELSAEPSFATRLVVKRSDATQFVQTADVDWIDAAGNYVRLHVAGAAFMLRATMADVESRLDPRRFVRVHRSAIVNLDRIAKVEPFTHGEYVVVVADGTRLRTSRAHSGRLRELIRKGFD
jgi:two-component system, LytTR family, response regulator